MSMGGNQLNILPGYHSMDTPHPPGSTHYPVPYVCQICSVEAQTHIQPVLSGWGLLFKEVVYLFK